MKVNNLFLTLSLCCAALVSTAQTNDPRTFPDRMMLTWSNDPSTTQSVTWRVNSASKKIIGQLVEEQSSPDLEEAAQTVLGTPSYLKREGGDADTYGHVTFKGLKPGTLYTYRVGDGELWSAWNQFRTADPSGDFSFIYLGDAQNDIRSRWSRSIRKAFQHEPNARFIVHAGDLINRSNTDSEWGEWYEGSGFIHQMIPAIATPGNHEYRRDSLEQLVLDPHWKTQFQFPKNGPVGMQDAVYYIDYQDLRMISLNSQLIMLDSVAAKTQEKWLEDVLASSKSKWNIVVMHHPVYSTSKDRDNTILREHFKPIFEKYGVDIVLQGHDHTYARGTGGKERPVYLLSVAGPKMYESDSERWMEVSTSRTQLYQVIRVTDSKLYFSSYKLNGQLFDSFELSKK
ncbi:metallophosphoesterase family protein [Sphingobacterium alkalisoli]|uniref:Metallophosphoesterase family protein n=1 Tax=Sphingobacterium alkalisoli TaxID=1874115 RepID=A0A4U0H2K5_9SPHI|nr:metallophosphoesterase family protein [Sphingobacterium alkalisoli]TJY65871.1 metallophosphoesterase family protein [Sphingobacterium alkalisoli]GGH17756.1 phosphoesterase [Sphingobacterium alkalisoli]